MSAAARNVILAARIVDVHFKFKTLYGGKYVVRGMTMTDTGPRHIYLKRCERRFGAYWAAKGDETAIFNSIEAAQAEIDRCLPRTDAWAPLFDIVPYLDRDVPAFWAARKAGETWATARVIGSTVVHEAV